MKKKLISLCIMFTAAVVFTIGCASNQQEKEQIEKVDLNDAVTVLGEGDTSFSFTVIDQEEKETVFKIYTEKETVGEALLELKLIDGEDSEYGLYVKTVNGITADYDKDGMYWAFYINGEYAETGVSSTKIVEGDQYSFQMEKG